MYLYEYFIYFNIGKATACHVTYVSDLYFTIILWSIISPLSIKHYVHNVKSDFLGDIYILKLNKWKLKTFFLLSKVFTRN